MIEKLINDIYFNKSLLVETGIDLKKKSLVLPTQYNSQQYSNTYSI